MKKKFGILPAWLVNGFSTLMLPIVEFFVKRKLNPNHFTTVGFLLSFPTAFLFSIGHLRAAGLMMLLSGLFDMIDGKVARATKRVTKFGALYDSTLDRYSELMIFFGLAYYFVTSSWRFGEFNLALLTAVAVSVAIGGSIMTSYVRARSEGLGLECKIGVLQRPDRVVLLAASAIIHQYVLVGIIIIIALLSNFTAVQRLYYVWKSENVVKSHSATEDDVY